MRPRQPVRTPSVAAASGRSSRPRRRPFSRAASTVLFGRFGHRVDLLEQRALVVAAEGASIRRAHRTPRSSRRVHFDVFSRNLRHRRRPMRGVQPPIFTSSAACFERLRAYACSARVVGQRRNFSPLEPLAGVRRAFDYGCWRLQFLRRADGGRLRALLPPRAAAAAQLARPPDPPDQRVLGDGPRRRHLHDGVVRRPGHRHRRQPPPLLAAALRPRGARRSAAHARRPHAAPPLTPPFRPRSCTTRRCAARAWCRGRRGRSTA